MKTEQKLHDLIISEYGAISTFTKNIGIPNSTFASIMQRGIMNSNMSSIFKICQALHISIDQLCEGEIISMSDMPKPGPLDIPKQIEKLCLEIRSRDQVVVDGEPISEYTAETYAQLIELMATYTRNVRTSNE